MKKLLAKILVLVLGFGMIFTASSIKVQAETLSPEEMKVKNAAEGAALVESINEMVTQVQKDVANGVYGTTSSPTKSVIPTNGGLGLGTEAADFDFLETSDEIRKTAATGTVREMILYWTNQSLVLIGGVVMIFLLYAAYLNFTAYGDTDKAKVSGKIIWSTIVGLMIIFGAYAIVNTALNDINQGQMPAGTVNLDQTVIDLNQWF